MTKLWIRVPMVCNSKFEKQRLLLKTFFECFIARSAGILHIYVNINFSNDAR